LRLPAELRNEIYKYALGGVEMVLFEGATPGTHFAVPSKFVLALGTHGATPEPVAHGLALTQVCRQLYAETRLLTFQLNDFYGSFLALEIWTKELNSEQVSAIRRLNLHIYWEDFFELFDRWYIATAPVSREEVKKYLDSVSSTEADEYEEELMDKAGDLTFETELRPVLQMLQSFNNPFIVDYTGEHIMELWGEAIDDFDNVTGMVVRLPNEQDW
jgi:hypothetical protein